MNTQKTNRSNKSRQFSYKQRTILTTLLGSALMFGATTSAYAHDDDRDDNHNSKNSQATLQYSGPIETISVEELIAKNNWLDDQDVTLEGHIIRQVGKRDFIFSDGTGEIQIELPKHLTVALSDKDKVRISGEYESDLFESNTLDVESLIVL